MTTEETTEPTIGERMREAFDGLDIRSAMRVAFGKCPECGERLVRGRWLRWCPDRTCAGYVGVLNKELGKTIEHVAPHSPAERDVLEKLAAQLEVEVS